MDTKTYNIIIEKGEDGYLIASVIGLPGCHTQAKNYNTLIKRIKEAISLYKSVEKENKFCSQFVGLQQIEA